MQENKSFIFHLITGLGTGGAESMLTKLVTTNCDYDLSHHIVISLTGFGRYGSDIQNSNIPVFSLGMKRGRLSLRGCYKFIKLFKKYRPVICIGWMYHSCVLLSLFKLFYYNRIKLIWNIRHTPVSLRKEKKSTAFIIFLGRFLSFLPDLTIYNSKKSKEWHNNFGYYSRRTKVIANGFDLNRFHPPKNKILKSETDSFIQPIVIGHLARFHEMKNHRGFLKSIALVIKEFPSIKVFMGGPNINSTNLVLVNEILTFGLADNIYLVDEITDTARFYKNIDVFCLSSAWGEGFPNVLGEAMATGIPCVTTDVGDSAYIVGNTGRVVPKNDNELFAKALIELLIMPRDQLLLLGSLARKRVLNLFNLDEIKLKYTNQFNTML